MATKKHGVAGEMLLQLLESRLDNVVFRLGFSNTREEARQLVAHGHILVNGSKVDIPSYLVKVGDVISIKEKSKSSSGIKLILAKNENRVVPGWLEVDKASFTGKVVALAVKADIDYPVQENLIVEFYSR